MSLITELRRRNVFRVGIAYLVMTWVVLQVVDVVAPMLNLPDWAARLVLLLLGIGFPVALVRARAFELTPDGLPRDSGAGDSGLPDQGRPFEARLDPGPVTGSSDRSLWLESQRQKMQNCTDRSV
jgi:hypothetical protein